MRWRKCSTGSCATARTKRSSGSPEIERYHRQVVRSLFADPSSVEARTEKLASEVRELLRSETCREDYDRWYDRIVSYGELLSTVIVSEYLAAQGTPNRWLDMRGLFVTDSRYREATINVDRSARALRRAVDAAPERVLVGQGFIGATPGGPPDNARPRRIGLLGRHGPAICSMPGA